MAGYIGTKASVVTPGAERKKVFSITTTTSSLTGLAYTPGFVHVFHNGVRLVDGTDYTATNGTSITLTTAAQNGDEVVVISYATFEVADAYTKAESDDRYVNVTGDTMTGALAVNGNLTVDTNTLFVDAANNRVGVGTSSPLSPLVVAEGTGQHGFEVQPGTLTYVFAYDRATADYGDLDIAGQTLRFSTDNGSERMRIDSAGRVTMPYQPMASVSFVNSGTTASGTYELVYTLVLVNVGSHYNASNGRFTCPVTGVYRVSAFGMGQLIAGNHNFFVSVRKNGSQQGATAYNYGTPEDYKHASGNWLVSCVAGDYLSIFVGGTGGYYGDGYQGATFELVG